MTSPSLIAIVAPGAGYGHLVRASALGLALADRGIGVRIVTHSLWAQRLAGWTGLAVDVIPARVWPREALGHVASLAPRLVVLDTFPFGLRGEWPSAAHPELRYVLLARRLKPQPYQDVIGRPWDDRSPTLRRIIALEPLGEYERILARAGGDIFPLAAPVRFPDQRINPAVPTGLGQLLETGRAHLVVHSGPRTEVDLLIRAARKRMDADGDGVAAVVGPRSLDGLDIPVFDYFPASRLYGRVRGVVTGAGYNAVAEGGGRPRRHEFLPFERRFDDQAGRLFDWEHFLGFWRNSGDGARQAADILQRWG
jgi:hypothetical protein